MTIFDRIKNKAQQALQSAGNFIDQDKTMGGIQLAQGGLGNKIAQTVLSPQSQPQSNIPVLSTVNKFFQKNVPEAAGGLYKSWAQGVPKFGLNNNYDVNDPNNFIAPKFTPQTPAEKFGAGAYKMIEDIVTGQNTGINPAMDQGFKSLVSIPQINAPLTVAGQKISSLFKPKTTAPVEEIVAKQPDPIDEILTPAAPVIPESVTQFQPPITAPQATPEELRQAAMSLDEILKGRVPAETPAIPSLDINPVAKLPRRPANTMYVTPEGTTFKVNRQPKTTASLDEILNGVEQATGKEITQFTKPTSYKRGDITKIQKQLDELLGTDSFRFNNKWQSVSLARDTAIKQAEYYASTGDPDAVADLDEIRSLMNKLDDARSGVTTPPQTIPTGIKPVDKTIIETKALPAGEQPLALPVGDQSNLTITQIKKMANAGSDTSGVTFTAKNADEARQAIKAGLKPEQITIAKKTIQSGDSLIFPQEEAALRLTPKTTISGTPKATLARAWDSLARSSKGVIGRSGKSGSVIRQTLEAADEEGALSAGAQVDEMYKALKGLSKEEKATFADVIEGRLQPLSDAQLQAANTWKNISEDIYQRALDAGLDIGHLEGYFPHNIITGGDEKAIAGLMGRNAPRRYGNLELARQTDLPWDKDPSVLTNYIESANKRIAEARNFGTQDEVLYNLANKVGAEGGDANQVRQYLDQILGKNQPIGDKLSEGIRSVETIGKLNPLTSVTNLTQNLSTMMGTDVGSITKATFNVIKNPEQAISNAIKAGEIGVDEARVFEDIAGRGNAAQKWIRLIGMGGTEKANRIIAVNSYMEYGAKMLRLANEGDQAAIRELERLGVTDLAKADLLKIGRLGSKATQFSTAEGELPYAWKTPLGKVLTQFKSFAYKQTGFLADQAKRIASETTKGNFKPLTNALATYGLAAPVVGEIVNDIRSVVLNKKRESKLLSPQRYVENILGATSFGLFDSLEGLTGKYGAGGVVSAVAGPAASDLYKGAETIAEISSGDKYEQRKAARNVLGTIPVVGRTISNTVVPNSYIDNLLGGVNEGMSDKDTQTYRNLLKSDPGRAEEFKQEKIQQRNAEPGFLEKIFSGGEKKITPLSKGSTPEERKAFESQVKDMFEAGGVPDNVSIKQFVLKDKDINSKSIEERTKAYSSLKTAMDNEYYSDEQKQAILDASGANKDNYDYYSLAGKDQDIKLQELLPKLDNMDSKQIVETLMQGRKAIAGKQLVSNAMVDYLYENNYIDENAQKAIKALKFDEIQNKFYFAKSFGKTGSMTYKQAKALYKIDLPQFSTLKNTTSLLNSYGKSTQTGQTNDKLIETILNYQPSKKASGKINF